MLEYDVYEMYTNLHQLFINRWSLVPTHAWMILLVLHFLWACHRHAAPAQPDIQMIGSGKLFFLKLSVSFVLFGFEKCFGHRDTGCHTCFEECCSFPLTLVSIFLCWHFKWKQMHFVLASIHIFGNILLTFTTRTQQVI